jgi:hypothetical protein
MGADGGQFDLLVVRVIRFVERLVMVIEVRQVAISLALVRCMTTRGRDHA